MKAILLVSSIFYLLGLKISNNIELFKKNNVSNSEITKQVIEPDQTMKNTHFGKEIKTLDTSSDQDSTQSSGSSYVVAPCNKKSIE